MKRLLAALSLIAIICSCSQEQFDVSSLSLRSENTVTVSADGSGSWDSSLILSAAFSLEDGITAPTPDKARVKGSLLSMRSPFKVLVADSSKYGLTQLFEVGRLSDLDLIITDSRLSQDALQAMERAGLKVICTSRDTETDLSSLRLR